MQSVLGVILSLHPTALIALSVFLLVPLALFLCSAAGGGGGGVGASGGKFGRFVVVTGARGAGKTARVLRLCRGVRASALPGLPPSQAESCLAMRVRAHARSGDAGAGAGAGAGGRRVAPAVTLVDGIVIVVDAAGKEAAAAAAAAAVTGAGAGAGAQPAEPCDGAFAEAADTLAALFTNAEVIAARVPVLLACSKADAAGARGVAAVRALVERALERRRQAAARLVVAAAAASPPAALPPLPLGRPDAAFSFATDAPLPISFCAVSAAAPEPDACSPVVDFVERAAATGVLAVA